MKTRTEYTLFSRPISRRTFYWVLFLCPAAALVIYLNSRSVVSTDVAPSSPPPLPTA